MSIECCVCGMELSDKDIGEHEELCEECRGLNWDLIEYNKGGLK